MFDVATMLLIVLLWFGISAPLSAIGSYIGSRQGVRARLPVFAFVRLAYKMDAGCFASCEGESNP